MRMTKIEIQKWTESIQDAYQDYKHGVMKEFENREYPEEPKQPDITIAGNFPEVLHYMQKQLELKLKQTLDRSISNYSDGLYVPYPTRSEIVGDAWDKYEKEHTEWDEIVREIDKGKCKLIREICEPVAAERDSLINMLYKQPTREEIDMIEQWCNQHKKTHERSCED